jgi:hydrogenase nickel incorporation protein HypA/HybF
MTARAPPRWHHDQTLETSMHELSIATAVIDEVSKQVAGAGGGRVLSITLRIGRLSCVQEGSLRFCFDLASADTELSGARLEIIDVPVRIWCPACAAEQELPGVQSVACPECGRLSGDIRAGRELDLESIELEPLPPPATEQTAIPPTSIEPDSIAPQPLQQKDQP